MAETSYVWDGILLGDATNSPYSAAEWTALWNLLHGVGDSFPNYGVLKGTGPGTFDPLNVHQTSIASTNIEVVAGSALVNGWLYKNSATVTLPIGANASGNPRIDTVVLRVDVVAQTVRLVVKQGTPAGSPARPALTQTPGGTWEIPLADIAVANGFSTITDSNISQRQRSVQSLANGWSPAAYPLNFVHNTAYTATFDTINANGRAVAIPFHVRDNLLLESLTVQFVASSPSSTYPIRWGLYVQDVNDGNTAENTLRKIFFNDVSVVFVTGVALRKTLSAGNPIPIAPGTYWVVVQNNDAANNLRLGALSVAAFEDQFNSYIKNTNAITLAQTNDLVTGWTGVTNLILGARLNGRVFGQTSAV